MIKKKVFLICLVLAFLVLFVSYDRANVQQQKIQTAGKDAGVIARTACKDVGVVRKVSKGTTGASILLLEENHVSRIGQIQHAITLVRLYDKFGLRNIALEGYLKEDEEINVDWYNRAANGDPEAKTFIAVRLLKEGEISCAEFMKLIYHDVFLHPIETTKEYIVELDEEASRAPIFYLFLIAQQSLREEHVSKLKQIQEDIKQLEKNGTKDAIQKKYKELFDYILSADSWAQAKTEVLQDVGAITLMSGEQHLALIEEIVDKASTLSIDLKPEEKSAMERYLAFWRGRVSASKTMVLSSWAIADQRYVSVIAMVVGAAHTEGMCSMLSAANRPFAVVTPLSFENREQEGDLTWDMLNRKYKRLSVYSEGFIKTFLKAFPPPKQKKPKPVLQTSWLQARAELYLFTHRIAHKILSSIVRKESGPPYPPGPPGGGTPPFGFSNDDFKGKWTVVDSNRISVTFDTNDRIGKAIIFPVLLNPSDATRRTEIWVKAGLGTAFITSKEREDVETMLKRALQEVQSEQEPNTRLEDRAGRVQITLDTIAVFAPTQEAVRRIALGSI